jgi:hypothetical protein
MNAGAAVALVAFCWLAALSRGTDPLRLTDYFLLFGMAWVGVLVAWWACCGQGSAAGLPCTERQKPEVHRRSTSWTVWLWTCAVLFRLAGFLGDPLLEDDYHRYLWDGRMMATTGNPYASKPSDFFQQADLPDRFRVILDNINHPDTPTIYGPICQAAFAVSYWIAPGQLWPLKVLLLLADLFALRLLFGLATRRHVLLYAFCPLLIQETAFTAHPDTLGVACLIAAMAAFQRARWGWVAGFLALATGAKVFALVLVPFLLWPAPKRFWGWFAGALVAVYLPFVLQDNAGGSVGLGAFLHNWEFNSTGYALLKAAADERMAKVLAAVLFATAWLACWAHWRSALARNAPVSTGPSKWSMSQPALPRGDWIFGMFFLLAPVVNPWYLLWLLPFVVLQPTAAGVTALAVVSLSYACGLNLGIDSLGAYGHPAWVRLVEIGAVAAALLWDWRRRLLAAERDGR